MRTRQEREENLICHKFNFWKLFLLNASQSVFPSSGGMSTKNRVDLHIFMDLTELRESWAMCKTAEYLKANSALLQKFSLLIEHFC